MVSTLEGTITMTRSEHFIQALHLFSPSLPIGAFAFSQGLEAAIESRYVHDAESLRCWCDSVMRFSFTTLDCRCAVRSYRADSESVFREVNAELLASRETRELLQEDLLLGAAMKKWAIDQGVNVPEAEEYSLVCLYGWVSARYEIPEDWLVSGILWSWLDNQMLVAAKAIPLGQNALQGILSALKPVVAECVGMSRQSATTEAHSTVPLLSILSAQHETQYSRLFRS
ncbi:MAG TPA: urease accessory protein UreF [Gammaproteobacteria bacterium]|nr:urease accessory protein UreF [Gammaproteobacteria bacterium]